MPPYEVQSARIHEMDSKPSQNSAYVNVDRQGDSDFARTGKAVKIGTFHQQRNFELPQISGDSDDLDRNKLILFGKDISNLSSLTQFFICGGGVFFFTIIYGFLQELITVQIAGRNFAIFIATIQFAGYAFWSLFLDSLRPDKRAQLNHQGLLVYLKESVQNHDLPLRLCISLSTLKALDLGLTYLALRYLNYPAKTLIKSSRVPVTMFLGIIISGKTYTKKEYANVLLLVGGLAIFLHADAKSSAVFHPIGVLMLVTALLCDGLLSNISENVMNEYRVGHDEFQLHISSIATLILGIFSFAWGDFILGWDFFFTPGTFEEIQNDANPTWTVSQKLLVVIFFSAFGLFGASCAGAITKTHGAFYMSLTTTSRKAATLMISFILFPNMCTFQHSCGIALFMFALFMKSLKSRPTHERKNSVGLEAMLNDVEDDQNSGKP